MQLYRLILSDIYRKQIKTIAGKSQKRFLAICESWDEVHKKVNRLGPGDYPFQKGVFIKRVQKSRLFLVYFLDIDKKELGIRAIVTKNPNRTYIRYRP